MSKYVIIPGAVNKLVNNFALQAVERQLYKPGVGFVVLKSKNPQGKGDEFETIDAPERDVPTTARKSKLGTPIFSDLQFDNITWQGVEYVHDLPIDTVLFTVNQQKNIIKTSIQGRKGTVKEYISDGDYMINIKGIICGDNGVYPQSHVDKLIQFLSLPVALPIISSYLQLFDIYNIVVDSWDMPQMEGSNSVQIFNINCISDLPVELKIKEAK